MKFNPIGAFTSSLKGYNFGTLKMDLIAGLTVAVMLVPQGMAYALLAGLPPIYGLYSSIIPLILYAFFGTSRHLSVGPVAIVSLLVLSGLSAFAEPGTDYFITLAISTAFIAGIIQILLGLFRLGFLINFLSSPVILGFITAAALLIGGSQMTSLLGLTAATNNNFIAILYKLATELGNIHLPTFLLAVLSILFLVGFKKIDRRIPGPLIVVVVSTLIISYFGLNQHGIQIVGHIPKGLPHWSMPDMSLSTFTTVLPLALTICLISFIESLAISKRIVSKLQTYQIDPDQELMALGISKVGGSFFQGFPTTGSFVRTAINFDNGAQTGISSILTAIFISIVLLFLTPLFYFLPKATLSAIIVLAVLNLVDIPEIKRLYQYHKVDFLTMLVTFVSTLVFGVQQGVFTGVLLSLGFILYRNSKPHVATLGQLPGTRDYRNVQRFPQAINSREILIVRFDAQLYFANAAFFQDSIWNKINANGPETRHLILDASSISDIDYTGIESLIELAETLTKKNITFSMTRCIGPIRDIIAKTPLKSHLQSEQTFLNIHDAIHYLESRKDDFSIE